MFKLNLKSLIALGLLALSSNAFAFGNCNAVSFDQQSGIWGRTMNASSVELARLGAINECQAKGGNYNICSQSVSGICGGYVVLAVGDGNHFYIQPSLYGYDAAENGALVGCQERTTNCSPIAYSPF